MDCFLREVGVELLPLPVLDLELQMDCYLDEVALVQRHLQEQRAPQLLVQVVELA
jgi:hypothetical protein